MRTVQMPKWVALCLVVSLLSALSYGVIAQSSYTLVKPFVLDIITAPSPFTITSVSFSFNPAANRYDSCNVTVYNTGVRLTATVSVYLRNSTAHVIASGQATQSFNTGSTQVTVALTWRSGCTVTNVADGYIVIA